MVQLKTFLKKGHEDVLKREQLYQMQYGTMDGYEQSRNADRTAAIINARTKGLKSRKLAQ